MVAPNAPYHLSERDMRLACLLHLMYSQPCWLRSWLTLLAAAPGMCGAALLAAISIEHDADRLSERLQNAD